MEIRKIGQQEVDDFISLVGVFRTVFENEDPGSPGREYLQQLLARPDFIAVVARENNAVTGGLTAYVLHGYYSEKPVAYIYDIGVLPAYQRSGTGKMLIRYLVDYCRENGMDEAYVAAEAADEQAVHFYRSTPYSREMEVLHFTYQAGKLQE